MSKILDKIVLRDTKTGISTEYTIQDTQLKERVENLIANKNDTNGNSELIDIRTGFDGNKYDTAGDAVRSQVSNLQEQVNDINNNGLIFNDDYISLKIDTWLKDHPEATTTVLDNSITKEKIEENFLYDLRKARFYNSVADMKLDSELKAGQVCKTLGYYSINDGGGAYYTIREKADGNVDDGGSVHELANELVAELIVENGTVNVKQFGAKGDGVTDDTAAIKAAVSLHGRVFFPIGTYIVSDTITLGWGRQIIGSSYSDDTTLQMITDGKPLLKVENTHFVQIRNICLLGNNDWDNQSSPEQVTNSDGILLVGANVVTLENVHIKNFKDNGIKMLGGKTSCIQVNGKALYVKNNSGCGIYVSDVHGCIITSSNIEFNKYENIKIMKNTMDVEFNSINCNFSAKEVTSVISILNTYEQDNVILKNIHIEDAGHTPSQKNVAAVTVEGKAYFEACYLRYAQGNYTDGIKITTPTGGWVTVERCVFRQIENPINSTIGYANAFLNYFYSTTNKLVGNIVKVENQFKSMSTAVWCKNGGTNDVDSGLVLPYGYSKIWRAYLTIIGAEDSLGNLAGKKVKLTTYDDNAWVIAENTISLEDFFTSDFFHKKNIVNLITSETKIIKITIPASTQVMDLGLACYIDVY